MLLHLVVWQFESSELSEVESGACSPNKLCSWPPFSSGPLETSDRKAGKGVTHCGHIGKRTNQRSSDLPGPSLGPDIVFRYRIMDVHN